MDRSKNSRSQLENAFKSANNLVLHNDTIEETLGSRISYGLAEDSSGKPAERYASPFGCLGDPKRLEETVERIRYAPFGVEVIEVPAQEKMEDYWHTQKILHRAEVRKEKKTIFNCPLPMTKAQNTKKLRP